MPIPVLQRRLRDQSLARRGRRVQHPRLRSNAILAVLQLPRHRSTEASDGVEVHAEEVLVVLEVDGPPRKQEEKQSVLGRLSGVHRGQVRITQPRSRIFLLYLYMVCVCVNLCLKTDYCHM